MCLSLLPRISDFILFWFMLEMLILIFIGIAYTTLTNSISPLIVFFLMQTLSSFLILMSYLTRSTTLFSVGVVIKIGIGPALGWFIYSVVHFPSLLLLISCTIHKLPLLILITQFSIYLSSAFFWAVVILNTLIRGFLILSSLDLRYLLVASSVSNNSWFLVRQLSGVTALLAFFIVYSLTLSLVIWGLSSLPRTRPYLRHSVNSVLILTLASLSGLPPSPLFFIKIYTILCLPSLRPLTCLFLLSSCAVLCSYLIYCIHIVTLRYINGH